MSNEYRWREEIMKAEIKALKMTKGRQRWSERKGTNEYVVYHLMACLCVHIQGDVTQQ